MPAIARRKLTLGTDQPPFDTGSTAVGAMEPMGRMGVPIRPRSRWLLALGTQPLPVGSVTADTLGAAATVLNTTSNTFTRATSAYDPNADAIVGSGIRRQRNQTIGTTVYAMDLIEGARTNLLAAGTSERFDQWTAASGLTVTADTTAAPNGEVIAQTLTDPGGSLSVATQAFTVADDSLLHVFSIYVLKTTGGTAPTFGVTLAYSGGTPTSTVARINTDTGAQQYGSNANTSVVSANTLWWRVIVVAMNNTTGNTTLTVSLFPAAAANGGSVDAAAATGTAIVAYADLNKSAASATSFFAASYNSRRNCLLQSEVLNTTWTKTRTTITSDSTANPIDGAANADTIVEDNTATNTHSISQVFTKAASAIQFTFSTYLKQSGRTWAFVECTDTGITNGAGIYFDVANGVKGTAVALGAGWTLDASTITAVGSWYRCTITVTTNTATTIRANIFSATADLGAIIVTPLNAAALICWGNQLVYGAKPQAYWATTTAGLRAGDLLISTASLSTTAGTIVLVLRPYGWTADQDGNTAYRPLAASTSADANIVRTGVASVLNASRADAGGNQAATITGFTPSNGINSIIGFTWGLSIQGYLNGTATGAPDSTLTPPFNAVTSLGIGSSSGGTLQSYGYVLVFSVGPVWGPAQMAIFAAGVAA